MPYASQAQRGYFDANRAKLEKQGVDVDEWNAASKGEKLPARVKPTTHNSPPALSKFASNNASPSNRQNLNPIPKSGRAMSGAEAGREFNAAVAGVPRNVKGPKTINSLKQGAKRPMPQAKLRPPAAVGAPGNKLPQKPTAGLPDATRNSVGSISARDRLQSLADRGMISGQALRRGAAFKAGF